MTLDTKAKVEAAQRLIKVVTGEEHGDGITVTDFGVGYAEPGYHDNETVWVLGNWNDKSHAEELPDGGIKWITDDKTPSRLFDALERLGIEGEWLDEWTKCDHCYRIVRTNGDSYMWKRSYVDLEDGDVLCHECAVDPDFIEEVMELFINKPRNVITWCDSDKLESLGWERYNTQYQYESGFHPGQNARPETIFDEIQTEFPNKDVVFWLDEASQFYIGFSAFTKEKEQEEEE